MEKNVIKFIFGGVIFLFSTALGYFTASYLEKVTYLDYYDTLLIFGGVYVIIGIIVAKIYPISLGFLFSADILILHAVWNEYRGYRNIYKALILFVILAFLYVIARRKVSDSAPPRIVSSNQK